MSSVYWSSLRFADQVFFSHSHSNRLFKVAFTLTSPFRRSFSAQARGNSIACRNLRVIWIHNVFEFFRGEIISPGHWNWQLKTAKYDVVCVLFCFFLSCATQRTYITREIVATDGGNRSSSVELSVTITNVKNQPPQWEKDSYSVVIPENTVRDTPIVVHWARGGWVGCKVKPLTAKYRFNYKVLIKLFKNIYLISGNKKKK